MMLFPTRSTWTCAGLTGLMLLTAFGCGSGVRTYPVTGKVVMKDGSPVTGGRLSFQATDGSVSSISPIAKDGSFSLRTFQPGDGVPAGTYQAVIAPAAYPDPDVPKPSPRFHSRYRRYTTSGLEFTVEPKTNNFIITLDPLR